MPLRHDRQKDVALSEDENAVNEDIERDPWGPAPVVFSGSPHRIVYEVHRVEEIRSEESVDLVDEL